MAGKIPKGVLVTFDDGASGLSIAGQILASNNAAGVAFICPGTLDKGLWFYRLADALVRATADDLGWQGVRLPLVSVLEKQAAYRRISSVLFDRSPVERDQELECLLQSLHLKGDGPYSELRTLDEAGLRNAARARSLFFANHSWSHPNLAKLSNNELVQEIDRSANWLSNSGLPVINWFAFPRGSYNEKVRNTVQNKHPVVFGARGWEATPGVLPRVYLCEHDHSAIRFTMKTAGGGKLYALRHRFQNLGQNSE